MLVSCWEIQQIINLVNSFDTKCKKSTIDLKSISTCAMNMFSLFFIKHSVVSSQLNHCCMFHNDILKNRNLEAQEWSKASCQFTLIKCYIKSEPVLRQGQKRG